MGRYHVPSVAYPVDAGRRRKRCETLNGTGNGTGTRHRKQAHLEGVLRRPKEGDSRAVRRKYGIAISGGRSG
jgi:hypothetical protein